MLYGTNYHFFRWITQRKVFGKPLHSQAVIRAKIAGMISRAESKYHRWPRLIDSNFLQITRRSKLAGEYHLSDVQHGNYHLLITASFVAWCSPQSYKQQAGKLAGYVQVLNIGSCRWWTISVRQIALLKSYSTGCGQDTARDAVQVFGGRGITQTGMGKYIEHVCYTGTCFFTCAMLNCLVYSTIALFHSMPYLVVLKTSWRILAYDKHSEACLETRGCREISTERWPLYSS